MNKLKFTILTASAALALQCLTAHADISVFALPPKPSPSPADLFPLGDAAGHAADSSGKVNNGKSIRFDALEAAIAAAIGVGGMSDSEQGIANVNTAWASATVLRQTAALTANRSSALPLAASVSAGTKRTYIDKSTGSTSAFARSFTPAGPDTINGLSTYTPFKGPGTMTIESDGVSAWVTINDTASISMIQDGTDPTKQIQFDASALGTGETRTVRYVSPTTPVITAQAGAGTAPTVSISGDAEAGTISITYGTTPTAGVAVVHVAPTTAYSATPRSVTITGNNGAALALQAATNKGVFTGNLATTGWDVMSGSTAGTAGAGPCLFNYRVAP